MNHSVCIHLLNTVLRGWVWATQIMCGNLRNSNNIYSLTVGSLNRKHGHNQSWEILRMFNQGALYKGAGSIWKGMREEGSCVHFQAGLEGYVEPCWDKKRELVERAQDRRCDLRWKDSASLR